jgi:IS30 family transposase
MARGTPLTIAEKHAIKSMVSENMETSKIALHLGRTSRFIQKYIDKELSTVSSKEEEVNPTNTVPVATGRKVYLPEDVEQKAFRELLNQGWEPQAAMESLKKLKNRLVTPVEDYNVVVNFCKRNRGVKNMFVTKSSGGKKGVTIMTGGAAQKGDDSRNQSRLRDTSTFLYSQPEKPELEDSDEEVSF